MVEKKKINVVGAAVVSDGTVLCAKRGAGGSLAGCWEFPGGKIEPGESPRQALQREIEEELLCRVDVGEEIASTTCEYSFGVVTLTTFYCALLDGTPQLTEHAEVRWVSPADMGELEWAPADVPAVQKIQGRFAP
ncbi:(deoxy)nucleoside triphosphate pyrophosphohydrolase [Arthrobacter rhombi]|uniref:(deoxy)nucleoside triphosphate pyrophosphohydrolase n=1 Tax=Arthrobacter rhombi TaxID=71253 RepID=UPI003F9087AA